ncbi:uncharacterized protein LOC122507480 [Leptopilina heterotoma]|uniref:uncharacterized protein LOC122507480 n=1 Tax=Leptopilina heterotoma TaxID=63436 RepID=UPI001CA938F0|nr:uncharacterized protein LOC122507480 [Leptopilina heterotoma]
MFKFFYIFVALSIIFNGQSASAARKKKPELVPVVYSSKLTSYEIEPNNNIIENKEKGLIQWNEEVKEGPEDLQIYIEYEGEDQPLEDLCKKGAQTIFPTVIKRFLGIESCPIKKNSLSLIARNYSRPGQQGKDNCEKPQDFILKLFHKKEKKSIMTLNVRQEDIRLAACK